MLSNSLHCCILHPDSVRVFARAYACVCICPISLTLSTTTLGPRVRTPTHMRASCAFPHIPGGPTEGPRMGTTPHMPLPLPTYLAAPLIAISITPTHLRASPHIPTYLAVPQIAIPVLRSGHNERGVRPERDANEVCEGVLVALVQPQCLGACPTSSNPATRNLAQVPQPIAVSCVCVCVCVRVCVCVCVCERERVPGSRECRTSKGVGRGDLFPFDAVRRW
jgi:hypothetical protein